MFSHAKIPGPMLQFAPTQSNAFIKLAIVLALCRRRNQVSLQCDA
jgi:hypothetical protein